MIVGNDPWRVNGAIRPWVLKIKAGSGAPAQPGSLALASATRPAYFPAMKRLMQIKLAALVSALVVCNAAPALAAELGDPAAPLTIKEWVKGTAVDVKDGKNIYVVEFWATWCPPCRTSIPHLTELQKKFKDKGVVVVGVSSSDKPGAVPPFVEKMGAKMGYTVAVDDANKTSKGYMTAYKQNGIPTAFIVGKDGKVAWVGHPMDGLDKALEKVVGAK